MNAHTTEAEHIAIELALARKKVAELEQGIQDLSNPHPARTHDTQALSLREYRRYGRQMILPAIGLPGQLKMKQAHILVVGAGGLGCPVLLYLAAAGIGRITILDHDEVELSNLHRQVLHDESRIGINKARSAKIGLERINSDIIIEAHPLPFTPTLFDPSHKSTTMTPTSLLEADFDLLLDCTDNPATRHFLNSYAVQYKIPLVSGGAVRAEGTVGVFVLPVSSSPANAEVENGSRDRQTGPCYACVFPYDSKAPSWEDMIERHLMSEEEIEDQKFEKIALKGTGACSDEGVLGLLCGQVGLQMGCEAIRILLGIAKPTLHLLSPLSSNPLRTIKLRARQPYCEACGHDSLSRWSTFLETGVWKDWEDPLCELPGAGTSLERIGEKRWSAKDLKVELDKNGGRLGVRLIDVRPSVEWEICKIPKSENILLAQILRDPSVILENKKSKAGEEEEGKPRDVIFICRRGNDSIVASRAVRRFLNTSNPRGTNGKSGVYRLNVGDLKNGLVGWTKDVDENVPVY